MVRIAFTSIVLVLCLAPGASFAKKEPHRANVFKEPLPSGRVADELRAAVKADDDATIRRLAASPFPDPFYVAARLLFPFTETGAPTGTDREALRRFAAAASDVTGVRAFIEHWLAADDAAFARERKLWGATGNFSKLMEANNYTGALEASNAALELLAELPHSHQGPFVRGGRARVLRRLGRTAQAVEELQALIERLKARRWPAMEGLARVWLTDAMRADGRPDTELLAEITRADALLTSSRTWKHLADALAYRTQFESRLGRWDEAEASVYRSIVVAKETGRTGDRLQGLVNLYALLKERDRPESATALLRQVHAEAISAGNMAYAAWTASRLAHVELNEGRTAGAVQYGDWLEDHLEAVTSQNVRGHVELLLGDLAWWRGQAEIAEAHFHRAVAAHRAAGSPVLVFGGLGRIVKLRQDEPALPPADAKLLLALREAATKAAIGPDEIPVLAAWSRYELSAEHLDQAAQIAERAAARVRSNPDARGSELATTQLARIHMLRRDVKAAVGLLEPLAADLPSGAPSRIPVLELLGRCHIETKRWADATRVFREVIDLRRGHRERLSSREALGQRAREHDAAARGLFAAARWAASGSDEALEAAWWFREMAGGHLLAGGIAGGTPGPSKTRTALADALTAVERAHGDVVVAVVAGAPDAQKTARARLERAYETLARAEARASRDAGGISASHTAMSLASVQAGLDKDTAIVGYTVGHHGVVGLVLTSDGARVKPLGDSADIERLVTRWRRLAATPGGPDQKLAARLYDVLLRPFDDLVQPRKRWIVLPDGALCGAPVDAWIRTSESGAERVLASHTVTYAHGHNVLAALEARQAARAKGRGIVALGNPTYPVPDGADADRWQTIAALGRGGLHMPALPSSGVEATRVAAFYPEAQRTLLLADGAAREAWIEALASREGPLDCVHLACHGLVDDRLPSLSGLVFAGGQMLTAERLRDTRVAADLVVLSACQSGGETLAAGEGLLGLTRAFFRSGVSRVLCTTWQVADDTTAALMVRFHEGRRAKQLSDAAALREARLALMRAPETAHPYWWAGFQLWGAPASAK
ncbi:MAG: CHAT domain-containing protein [Planctomycetota bacterium]|nr:CHAT domain-containing protein [Planctomycetota bacterium]